MRVLGISGSLRSESYNTRLLRAAAFGLPPGARIEHFDGLAGLPAFNEDAEHAPGPAVERWLDAIAGADAVLFATPEYNAGVPGALKNAVDWASRPFPDNVLRDKPVAVIGASTGLFGAVWAQADLRKSVRYAGAHVLDDELPVPQAADAFDADGRLRDPDLAARLDDLLRALVREVAAPVEVG
jgi:chromate reductase, NAD(P)H dehydrogenase (quinone)